MRRIVVMGAAIVDVLVRLDRSVGDITGSGSVPARAIRMSTGGDALNEAMVLAGLGADVELRTVLGEDTAGDLVRKQIREAGISISGLCLRAGLSTGINVVLVGEDAQRSFLTDPGGSLRALKTGDLSLETLPPGGILSFASIFVSPEIGGRELREIFSVAKKRDMTICADMTKPKNGERLEDMAPALSMLDYFLPNEEEACMLTGQPDASGAAEALFAAGVRHVAVKCGARGCLIRDRNGQKRIPAVENIHCIDTTGAGDSFAAGFLFRLSRGGAFRECARFANLCGGRATEHLGATEWLRNP